MFTFTHLFTSEVFTAKVMTTLPGILYTRAAFIGLYSFLEYTKPAAPKESVFSAIKYCHSSLHLLQFFIYIYSTFTSQFRSLCQITLISF